MKLINYDYGFTPADPTSGTYYRGKIQMTLDEFNVAMKYLLRAKIGASYEHDSVRERLTLDLARPASVKGNGFHVAIRVPATEKLVSHYNLPRYKRQNYFIHVTPN
jgi:hypothetical protein